jgi:hypothetical protein
MKMIKDRPALAAQFRAWAARPASEAHPGLAMGRSSPTTLPAALNRLADSLD